MAERDGKAFGVFGGEYAGTVYYLPASPYPSSYATVYDGTPGHVWYELSYYESKHDGMPQTESFDTVEALVAFLAAMEEDET